MSELALFNDREVQVRPVAGRIGAEVTGLRLGGDLEQAVVEAIRRALYRFKVLFFRNQDLDEAEQEAYGRRFGDLVPHPTIPSVRGTEHVLDVDGAKGARASLWHTDVTFVDAYPQISILRALVVPEFGGDTVWANTASAYQSLSPQLQELADKLWAIHTNKSDYGSSFPARSPEALKRYQEVFQSTVYETQHPVVRVHPGTRERTLVLGHFVRQILGVSTADSSHLFALLQGHITRLENTVRWRWSAGDVAMWDNRATQHSAVDDYGDKPRILRRVTVAGDVPISVDGQTSVLRKKVVTAPIDTAAAAG